MNKGQQWSIGSKTVKNGQQMVNKMTQKGNKTDKKRAKTVKTVNIGPQQSIRFKMAQNCQNGPKPSKTVKNKNGENGEKP